MKKFYYEETLFVVNGYTARVFNKSSFITNDLKWNTNITNICTKANRSLGFLRRNLFSCPKDVIEAAYTELMRPGRIIDILLYKGLKGKARIPTDDLIPSTRPL